MAIKGKTKRRGGRGRTASVAPKPIITERKPPILSRKPVRLGILIALVLLAVLGGLRVWQNLSRSSALKKYDRSLERAQALLTTHLEQGGLTELGKNVQDFSQGKLDGKRFSDLASVWEKDFRSAKDTVSKLKPPKQLRDAQELILQGIDGYVGVSRLFHLAAEQKLIADGMQSLAKAAKDPAQKKSLEAQAKKDSDQVQVILLQASEWRQRADAVYKLGTDKIDALKAEWHVEQPSTSEPGSVDPGSIPVGLGRASSAPAA